MSVILDRAWVEKYRQKAGRMTVEQLKSFAEQEIEWVLKPHRRVRKRDMIRDFGRNTVLSTAVPVVGPLALIVSEARSLINSLCAVVGLVDPKCSARAAVIGTLLSNLGVWALRELVPVVGSLIGVVLYARLHRKIVRDVTAEATKLHILWITQNMHFLFPSAHPPVPHW